jgi:hypothetical protein
MKDARRLWIKSILMILPCTDMLLPEKNNGILGVAVVLGRVLSTAWRFYNPDGKIILWVPQPGTHGSTTLFKSSSK